MAALELVQLEPGTMVGERFKVVKKLGEGGFGAVYRVADDKGEYAMKVEGIQEPIQVLKLETTVLQVMNDRGGRHHCKLEGKGKTKNFSYLIMSFVGKSLHDLRKDCPANHLSMGSAISVARQCLEALEDLHSIGYLHRDIKPGNYTVGRPEDNEARKVYILDFGMCRKYVDEKGVIKKPRKLAAFRGTVRYASIACHQQREMGRKDDLESWMYMSIEMMTGVLPWKTMQDLNEVGDYKRKCRPTPAIYELFIGCPREYMTITQAIHSYKFFDPPDYETFYILMRRAITTMGAKEFPYDWENPQPPTESIGDYLKEK